MLHISLRYHIKKEELSNQRRMKKKNYICTIGVIYSLGDHLCCAVKLEAVRKYIKKMNDEAV